MTVVTVRNKSPSTIMWKVSPYQNEIRLNSGEYLQMDHSVLAGFDKSPDIHHLVWNGSLEITVENEDGKGYVWEPPPAKLRHIISRIDLLMEDPE